MWRGSLSGYGFKGRLVLDCGDAGEDFALDGFEQGAATGRHVADFVGQTELVDAGN